MKPYPHRYRIEATAAAEGDVALAAPGLPTLETAPPEEFGGPGDRWSPETLLVAAVADCFALTFRAIAKASGLAWRRLSVSSSGTLDRADGAPRFTGLELDALLVVPMGTNDERALRLLEKAEQGCLITRSLVCPSTLRARVEVE